MGRIPAVTTLLHGQRSKCADLTEQLQNTKTKNKCEHYAWQGIIVKLLK